MPLRAATLDVSYWQPFDPSGETLSVFSNCGSLNPFQGPVFLAHQRSIL